MMSWDNYMRRWELHASTDKFKRRLDTAAESAIRGDRVGNLYCALSGGKDGVALAAVVRTAGLQDTMLAHMHTDLNTPGMLECAQETAEILDMDLDVIEPEVDVWQWLRSYPPEYSLLDPEHHKAFRLLFSSGNMLVAYQYANEFDGAFTGMRTAESKGRRWNRMMRGKLYQLASDASWICQPIVDWSACDVFACAVSMGLPIHPYYRLALERLGTDPEGPGSRVDNMIPEDRVTRAHVMTPCRVLYPELYERIVSVRPELKER